MLSKPQYANLLIMRAGRLTGKVRFDFIAKTSNVNVYLAARCLGTSIYNDKQLIKLISNKAFEEAKNNFSFSSLRRGFLALIEIGRFDLIGGLLEKFDREISLELSASSVSIIPKLFRGLNLDDLISLVYHILASTQKYENINVFKIFCSRLEILVQEGAYLHDEEQLDYIISNVFSQNDFNSFLRLSCYVQSKHFSRRRIAYSINNLLYSKLNYKFEIESIKKFDAIDLIRLNEISERLEDYELAGFRKFEKILTHEFDLSKRIDKKEVLFLNNIKIPEIKKGEKVVVRIVSLDGDILTTIIEGIPSKVKGVVFLNTKFNSKIFKNTKNHNNVLRVGEYFLARITRISNKKNKVYLAPINNKVVSQIEGL